MLACVVLVGFCMGVIHAGTRLFLGVWETLGRQAFVPQGGMGLGWMGFYCDKRIFVMLLRCSHVISYHLRTGDVLPPPSSQLAARPNWPAPVAYHKKLPHTTHHPHTPHHVFAGGQDSRMVPTRRRPSQVAGSGLGEERRTTSSFCCRQPRVLGPEQWQRPRRGRWGGGGLRRRRRRRRR